MSRFFVVRWIFFACGGATAAHFSHNKTLGFVLVSVEFRMENGLASRLSLPPACTYSMSTKTSRVALLYA